LTGQRIVETKTNNAMDYPYREWATKPRTGKMVRYHFVRIDDLAGMAAWLKTHACDDVFASLCRFREPDRKSPFLCDDCVFDLDHEDLQVVRAEALKLIDLLWKRPDIHPHSIDLAFSGAKGFHVRIPGVVFGHPADPNLLWVWKYLAKRLVKEGVASLDTAIYQPARLFRWVNTINTKSGLYKIALDYKELRDYDIAFVLETARKPREWTSMATPEESPRATSWLHDKALPWVQEQRRRTVITPQHAGGGWWYPHCLREIEQNSQITLTNGTRHETYKILSRFYARIGMSGSEAQARLYAIDQRNPIHDPDYIPRIVAFGQRAPGFPSCQKELLKLWCNPEQCLRTQNVNSR
jgi:hypothetical protein